MDESVTSPAADDARPLRSDAESKRRRILHAAREEFAENGLGATLDDVDRRAGVGVGTAYRRFGNKRVLINELFEERLDAMVTLAEEVLVEDDPWEGFVRFLTTALERMAGDRGLREVIFSEMHGRPEVAEARRRLLPAAAAVMRRAQDAGALRPDLAATDLPLIQYMVSHTIHYTQHVCAGSGCPGGSRSATGRRGSTQPEAPGNCPHRAGSGCQRAARCASNSAAGLGWTSRRR